MSIPRTGNDKLWNILHVHHSVAPDIPQVALRECLGSALEFLKSNLSTPVVLQDLSLDPHHHRIDKYCSLI